MKPEPSDQLEKRILQHSTGLQPPFTSGAGEAWAVIKARIDADSTYKASRHRPGFWAIAAGILMFVAMGGLVYFLAEVAVSTSNSARASTELPDGSTVVLHANSRISYNRLQWFLSRDVRLQGEAWFEVTEGRQFSVYTPSGEVEVLGTSFDVLATDTLLRVYCETGSVRVTSTTAEVVLLPGEMAYGSLHGLEKSVATYTPNFWLHDQVVFDNAPLEMVVSHLEREYGVTIVSTLDPRRHFSGAVPDDSLEDALEVICAAYGMKWSKEEVKGRIVVTLK